MKEKEKILEYVNLLMKEFNTIIILMLISMLLTFFSQRVFTILFIASLGLTAYKIIKINNLTSKLEDILKEDIELSNKEDHLRKCHKKLRKKESNEVKNMELVEVESIKEELDESKKIKKEIEESVKEDNKDYLNDFDYIDEIDEEKQ